MTHIYTSGNVLNNGVRKNLKSDLSYVGQKGAISGAIIAIAIDDTYVYAGGTTAQTVRKYLKSDMSQVGETTEVMVGGYGQ